MANGHVEIHDPLSTHNGLTISSTSDPKSTSDTDSMGDSVEFRILMAYAQRRRPKKDAEQSSPENPIAPNVDMPENGPSSPETQAKTEKETKKNKRKTSKLLMRLFKCIRPQETEITKEPKKLVAQGGRIETSPEDKCVPEEVAADGKEDEMETIASRLTEIADDIPFVLPDIEPDGPDDDIDENVETAIGLLLRTTGDQLNEELKNAGVAELFRNYSFFNQLMTEFFRKIGLMVHPDSLGPKTSSKTQIAVTCEVTSRLTALDTLPASRLLGFGARYLQDHFSSWIQQQGGYEEAFYSDDEDNEEAD